MLFIHDFRAQGWEFLPFRFSIGIWTFIMIMLLVAFDLSAYICYITRFTEENFATLIALIFIKKAFLKVGAIGEVYSLYPDECYCIPDNKTLYDDFGLFGVKGSYEKLNGTSDDDNPCKVRGH